MKYIKLFEQFVDEMGHNDVHFKDIMQMYHKGGSFTKKKIASVVCKDPKASQKQIEDALEDADYTEIIEFEDELGIHEGLIKEDIDSTTLLALTVLINAALASGLHIGALAGNYSGGDTLGPIDSIKKWWKDRKDDKAVKSIIAKIKDDPEMIEFFKLSQTQQRGKFRKLVATKLSSDEIQYLNRINKDDLRENNSIGEGFSEYSNDALADMIVNLSRYEGNEGIIENVKAELANRKQKESVNEGWEAKDDKVTSNGKLIGYYSFDRDSDSFWVDDLKGKGQLSFEEKSEVIAYFKKHEKEALKALKNFNEVDEGVGTEVGDSNTLQPNPGESEESFKIRTFSATVDDYEKFVTGKK